MYIQPLCPVNTTDLIISLSSVLSTHAVSSILRKQIKRPLGHMRKWQSPVDVKAQRFRAFYNHSEKTQPYIKGVWFTLQAKHVSERLTLAAKAARAIGALTNEATSSTVAAANETPSFISTICVRWRSFSNHSRATKRLKPPLLWPGLQQTQHTHSSQSSRGEKNQRWQSIPLQHARQ